MGDKVPETIRWERSPLGSDVPELLMPVGVRQSPSLRSRIVGRDRKRYRP